MNKQASGSDTISQPVKSEVNPVPDFSSLPRNEIPEKFKWKSTDLFESPQHWRDEKNRLISMCSDLDSLITDWTVSADRMFNFLDMLNSIQIKAMQLYSYAFHENDMDMANPVYMEMKGEMTHFYVELESRLSSFNQDIIDLGAENFAEYLKQNKGLLDYRFSVLNVLRMKKHILPEDQQKVVTLTGLFSQSMSEASVMLNDMDMPPKKFILENGREIELNNAAYVRYRASAIPGDRRGVMRNYWNNHNRFQHTFAALVDGAMKQHVFESRVHKYQTCLDSRLFAENIDPRVYHNLIACVRQNLQPLHRYLRLKRKILNLDLFRYEDIYASAVPEIQKKFSFAAAEEIIMDMAAPLGKEYLDILQKAFREGWIDIYPNRGKQSGAYSSGVYGVHPFIKLNYNGTYSALSTLAHELGHAMHSYLADASQPFVNSHYATFLAEIASTFNENLLVHYFLKKSGDSKFKLFILDGYIDQLRATVYRQTLFAEFELAMHARAEQGQTLTPQWLNDKYLELTREYYGHSEGVVKVGDFIRGEWAGIPHFFMNYYVFQYSTGIVASLALARMVLNGGQTERAGYLDMLRAGGNGFPLDILAGAGVDMKSPRTIENGLQNFSELVDRMEQLAR